MGNRLPRPLDQHLRCPLLQLFVPDFESLKSNFVRARGNVFALAHVDFESLFDPPTSSCQILRECYPDGILLSPRQPPEGLLRCATLIPMDVPVAFQNLVDHREKQIQLRPRFVAVV